MFRELWEKLTAFVSPREAPPDYFDPVWYLANNPDVARSGVDPWRHYCAHGRKEGRKLAEQPDAEVAFQKIALESGFFDPQWYIETYRDVPPSYMGPLAHFARYGAFEGRSPGPRFDAVWYLMQNQDIAGPRANPLLHYLQHGAAEGRRPAPPRGVLEAAGSCLAGVADLEPGLHANDLFQDVRWLPIREGRATGRTYEAFRKLFAQLEGPVSRIVVTPWLVHGGADRTAINALRALIERHGAEETLMIVADSDRLEARDWLPPQARVLCFSQLDAGLSLDDRVALVELLITALNPAIVLNVNSRACWEAVLRRGETLAARTDLYAALFCRDYTPDGRAAGFADTHFRDCLPFLTQVYFDSASFVAELRERYALPPCQSDKLVTLKQPVEPLLIPAPRKEDRRKARKRLRVLWAGRLCRQKNPELLIRIVENAPVPFHFDVWGRGDAAYEEQLKALAARRDNCVFRGSYESFAALPAHEYDAFLYTSLWDGLPNVLLEAASCGLPIVAADVGAVHELVSARTGWLVREYEDWRPYLSALVEIARDPLEAHARTRSMSDLLQVEHGWRGYRKTLSHPRSFVESQS